MKQASPLSVKRATRLHTVLSFMPVGFWQDPDGSKFLSAYFDRWSGIWAHGDYGEVTAEGGYIIHGRSDAVLNLAVRIGTAEVYRQVEQVLRCSTAWWSGRTGRTMRVILFVVVREGLTLDDALIARIQQTIRANDPLRAGPCHSGC